MDEGNIQQELLKAPTSTVTHVHKLLSKIATNPDEIKYRRLKTSSRLFRERFGDAGALLGALGFAADGDLCAREGADGVEAALRLVDARAIVAECNPYAEWPQWGDSALLTLPWRTRHNASVGPVVFADGVVLPLGGPIAAARRGRGKACLWCPELLCSARHLWATCPRCAEARARLGAEVGIPPDWWDAQPRVTVKSGWITVRAGP